MAPDTSVSVVLAGAGGGVDVFDADLVFDDAAVAVIPNGTAITSGSYRTANYGDNSAGSLPPGATGVIGAALTPLAAGGVNGDWKLYVSDIAGGDFGAIASWALEFDYDAPTPEQMIARDSNRNWRGVASSADGVKLAAVANNSCLYTSTDSGVTWMGRENNRNWKGVASSADGSKLAAVAQSGNIHTSTDSGATWSARMNDMNRQWYGVASSSDGMKLVACVNGGQVYTSTDSGVNWTARESARDWISVASSADGAKLAAAVQNGQIYVSTDSGVNWSPIDSARNWYGVASSGDGAKLVASVYGGQLYTLGAAPEIAVEQPMGMDLADGSTKDFGPVLPGGNADLTFTIRNPGNATLTGLGITIDGTDASLFTVTSSPSAPLSGPSGSTTFTVRFAPMSAGMKSATLHIASNDSDENPFDVILNGTGFVPPTVGLSIGGGMITLSWPATATGYQVESTLSLLPPVIWSVEEAGMMGMNGGNITMTISINPEESGKFFRLKQP